MRLWPTQVFDEEWREPTDEEREAIETCVRAAHERALLDLAATGRDPWIECEQGHPQVLVAECDGVHCHRSCDEIARTQCRRRWKMMVRS